MTTSTDMFSRSARTRYCAPVQEGRPAASEFHFNPCDSREDFDCSPNDGSPGDVSIFRNQFHRGFTNETQRKFDPALLTVIKVGCLRFAFYDGECVCADIIGTKDDGAVDVDPWFVELVAKFGGRVSL